MLHALPSLLTVFSRHPTEPAPPPEPGAPIAPTSSSAAVSPAALDDGPPEQPSAPVSSGPGEDESERSADPGDELEFDLGDFLSAPVEEGSPEPVPSAAPTRTRAPRRTPPAQSGSPLLLLAGLALDAVWTAALARDLDAGRPLALVIEAPGANWVQPARHVLAARLGRGAEYVTLTSRPKASTAASPDLNAARAVGSGKMLVAITPDLAWLSPVLVGAADHVLSLPPLTPAQVAEAITTWTGRTLRSMIETSDLTGLDLPDLAAALRPGTTPGACLRRIKRASRRRVGPPAAAGEVVPLETLAGLGEAQAWAMQLVAAIGKVKASRLEAALLEGAVFFGPPGTGKSTLARSIAAEAGVPYLETSVGQWFSHSPGHLDGVIKQVDRFCDELILAAKSAGAGTAIGFLDEIDALPNRARLSDRGADWWLPVITHCLLRIESLRRVGIVLLAATNDLSRVDAALLRPGRFDRQIEVPPPDEVGRLAALRHHLGRDLRNADLTPAVRLSRGATGAVLAGAVRAARRRADAAGRAMRLDDLLAEIAPDDGRSPADLRAAALHEAGHAVLTLQIGLSVAQVTVQAGRGSGGATTVRMVDPTPDRGMLERQVVSVLAGRAADVVLGTGADAGSASDLREATRVLAALHASFGLGARLIAPVDHERADELVRFDPDLADAVERDLQRLRGMSELLVRANRVAILAVADALMAARVLTGEEVAAIMAAHPPRVRVRAVTTKSHGSRQSGRAL